VIELKTASEIEAMRAAGRVVAAVHAEVRTQATVDVSLRELNEVAREVMDDAGAGSSFLGYHPHFAPTPYPGVICTSVNEVMLHGLPTSYRLRDGDLLSVDCGAHIDGWHATRRPASSSGRHGKPTWTSSIPRSAASRPASTPRSPARVWATSGTPYRSSEERRATASRTKSPDTVSGERCTRTPSSTTRRDPVAACAFGPGS
jgi:hypothetical protein